MAGDVRRFADNQSAVEACLERFGRLDCAIGNAGVWDYSVSLDALPVERIDAAFDEMFHVNVKGYLNLAKAALPALARSSGAVIFTVSNAGFDPAGGGPLYTASKHAVVGLVCQLAYEFAPAVRVNGVAPGPIETDLRGLDALGLADKSIGSLNLTDLAAPSMPLGIVPAASDYAGGYVFLAAARRFYRDVLGFRLSDIIRMRVSAQVSFDLEFFHCNRRHHSLALMPVPMPRRLHHFMIQAPTLDAVGFAMERAQAAGAPITATLGRHTNDHMVSFYARTPAGFEVEFGYGALEVDDATWRVSRHDKPSRWGHKRPTH